MAFELVQNRKYCNFHISSTNSALLTDDLTRAKSFYPAHPDGTGQGLSALLTTGLIRTCSFYPTYYAAVPDMVFLSCSLQGRSDRYRKAAYEAIFRSECLRHSHRQQDIGIGPLLSRGNSKPQSVRITDIEKLLIPDLFNVQLRKHLPKLREDLRFIRT